MADRNVSIGFSADVAGFMAGISSMKSATTGFVGALEKSATKRQALTSLGTTAGKVGLVAAAGLGVAVVAAARFDSAMSRAEAATHASAATMSKLRQAALEAGQATQFSATESADAITEMAKAGVSTANILGGGLTGALNLAAAGEMNVADAAQTAATTMNQFGLAGNQVGHIADVLAAAAGKAQGEVSDVALAMQYVGPVAAQMGVSLEETAGTIGELASQGIIASKAGTGLRGMLLSLTSPSAAAAEKMAELGINVYDAQGNFVGFDGVAGQLHKTMGNLDASARDAAFGVMFGNAQVTAARILYAGGAKAVDSWTNKVDDSGYAAETAAIKMDNLAGDFEKLKGSLETALIGTGSGAQAPLRGIVQGLEDVVNAYNKLPSPAKGGIASILGLTALAGGTLFGLSRVAVGIADTRKAMADLALQAPKTATAMSMIGKGVAFAAILEGLNLLDNAIDDTFNTKLDQTDLMRSLQSLSKGSTVGALLETWGEDLHGFSHALDVTDSKWQRFIQGPLGDAIPGTSELDDAEENIKTVDEALAGLVESGQKAQAGRIFDQLVAAAEAGGNSIDDVRGALTQYQVALQNAGGKDAFGQLFGTVGTVVDGVIDPIRQAGNAARAAAGQVQTLADALQSLSAFFDKRAALRSYQEALDGLSTSLKKNGGNFNISTKAGRENAAALDNVGTSALQVADKMKGANKVRFLKQTAADIASTAKRLGVLKNKDIQGVIDALLKAAHTKVDPKIEPQGIPKANHDLDIFGKHLDEIGKKHPSPVVTAIDHATGVLNAVLRGIGALPSSRTVTITTNHVTHYVTTGSPQGGGGYDPGDPHASGGMVRGPGTGTSDSISARLSNGEFVVRAAAVKKYGAGMLADINAERFASGGLVGTYARTAESSAREAHKQRDENKKHHGEHMKALKHQAGVLQKMLDKSTELNQAVQGNFRKDPFSSNFTLQGVLSSIRSDTSNAGEFSAAARNAKRLGLNGGVFQALLASGNTPVLEGIKTKADVTALERAWRARNKATADMTFGAATGGKWAGDTLAELQQELKHLRHEIKRMGHHVEKGAESGTRKGNKDHDHHRRRNGRRAALR